MTNHAIHWSEGLFLRPHHFQSLERAVREDLLLSENWNVSYAYGLRRIEIDHDALANWRISLRSLHARLHDGTHVRYPEGCSLDAVALPKDAFDRQERVRVYLALPTLRMGRKNADAAGTDPNCRYLVEPQEVEDENQGGNPQMLDVRRPNIRLLVGDGGLAGFDTLPVMQLRRGTIAEAPPELDPEYIPPLLACDAWPILQDEIIGGIYNQFGSLADILADQMIDRGVAFETGHREDFERILKLHSLNTALGYLMNLPFVRGVHPLTAYKELCRAVGQTAIFRPERRLPEVPRYDHDDLGRCFYAIKRLLQGRTDEPEAATYQKRPFEGAGMQMQVRLEREWLSPTWTFFIGVNSKLSYHECVNLLRGGLDIKVGSSGQVERIFNLGQAGVQLIPQPEVPRLLPGKNWTYWKVERDSNAWLDAEKMLSLAIRLNHKHIVGEMDGRQEIQVSTDDGREIPMSFALYAILTQHVS
jgi:type VI secretion system protein ImpJ